MATLTGACETALGDRVAGILGNDDALVAQTIAAGARAGEVLWPLPITAEMPEKVRTYSKVADLMQHNIDLYGGALYAAAFLQEFVGEHRWAHLDIAGPGFNDRGALRPRPQRRHRLHACRRWSSWPPSSPPEPRPVGLEPGLLAPAVVLPHPRRVADHRGVVRRDAVLVGEPVRPLHRRDPAPGPLAVVGDQDHGDVADRRARLDEPLDPAAGGRELAQVLLVGGVGGPHGRRGRPRVRDGACRCGRRGASRSIQPMAPVCPAGLRFR